MTGYTKLFGSIIASTIWCEDDQTRLVWITMLAMANQHGEVEASIPGLAKFAKVTVEATEAALVKLKAPDQYSRTKDFDGRRIEEIDGGWLILNHAKYRERASDDDRREQAKIRKQRQRKRHASVTQCHAPVTPCHDKQKQKQKQNAEAVRSSDKASEQASSQVGSTGKKLSRPQKLLADRIEACLGEQWRNDAGKWISYIKANPGKSVRVISEVENAMKEGRIDSTPAQYAEHIWQEFAT